MYASTLITAVGTQGGSGKMDIVESDVRAEDHGPGSHSPNQIFRAGSPDCAGTIHQEDRPQGIACNMRRKQLPCRNAPSKCVA